MLTNFERAHAELMAQQCRICHGNGASITHSVCATCKGTGFKDGKVPVFHAFRVEFVAEQCKLAYNTGRVHGETKTRSDAAFWGDQSRVMKAAQIGEHSLSLMTVSNDLARDPKAFVTLMEHELKERGMILVRLIGDTHPVFGVDARAKPKDRYGVEIEIFDEEGNVTGTGLANEHAGKLSFNPCVDMPEVYYIREKGTTGEKQRCVRRTS